ncbi:hypothetical protein B484DRAFT_55437 [Ochromonadaceae sp. CCMP2298]|nr:hypothetical protein B484DRAFT_55437 [Ochromonadaceae sp. CCMP2298]
MENVLGPELRADTVRAMMGAGAGMSSKMGAGMGAVDVTSPRVDYPVDVDGYERALSRASPNRRASVSRARGEGRKGAGAAAAAAEIVGAVGGDGLSPSGKNTRFWVGRMMPNEGSAKSPVRRESVLRRSLMVPTLSTKGEFEPATEEDAEGSDGWRSTTGSGGSSPVVRFPPAERVPMLLTPMLTPALPGTLGREHDHSRYLDVILSVEHCTDCHNHAGSLRHDPLKYATMAQRVLFALIGAVLEADLAVRVFALRARPESSRLGAFEVTVCVNVTPPLRGHAPVQKSDVGGMGVGPGGGLGETVAEALAAVASQKPKEDWSGSQGSAQSSAKAPQSALLVYAKAKPLPSGWTTHCVHSKLASKSFPGVRSVCDAAVAFLRTALSDSSQALGSAIHAATAARASKFAAVAGGAGAGAGTGFGAVGGKHMAQAHARQQQVWVEYLTSSAHPHLPFDLSDAQLWRYEGAKGASTAHKRAMQQSFEQWSQRMKIPPRVEHSPLNLMPAPLFELAKEKEKVEKEEEGGEEDTGKGTQGEHAKSTGPPIPKHPAGPYLDFEFASSVADRPCFERAVMKHFLVLDATPTAALLHEDPL